MAHQTAVEWLIEQISEKQPNGLYVIDTLEDVKIIFEQAKQMHEKQMFESFKAGQDSMEEGGKSFDIYIQETYGKADSSTLVS